MPQLPPVRSSSLSSPRDFWHSVINDGNDDGVIATQSRTEQQGEGWDNYLREGWKVLPLFPVEGVRGDEVMIDGEEMVLVAEEQENEEETSTM